MGWTTSWHWQTRSAIVANRVKKESYEGRSWECLSHCLRGNVLWTVWEVTYQDKPCRRFIGCDLLKNYGKNEGWGYKDMDESVGPFYYTCPLKYLKMVPEVSCQEWRDQVERYHLIRSQEFLPGMVVELVDGYAIKYLKLEYTQGSYQIGRDRNGKPFKISRRYLSGNVFETWPEVA